MRRKTHRVYLVGAAICVAMVFIACLLGKSVISEDYQDRDFQVPVYQHTSDRVTTLPLDTYLARVVGAEMPISFCDEAIKAQIVAARTYVVRRYYSGGNPNCPGTAQGALVCDDPAHAQAMQTTVTTRLLNLVHATDGQILVDAKRQPIDALFHSNCGGQGTASAEAIWGRDVAYLQSVTCQGYHPNKDTTQKLTSQQLLGKLETKLGLTTPALKLHTSPTNLIQTITLGDTSYQRQLLRDTLNLPSSTIFATKQGKLVTIQSKGAGHGVGMCQYGAQNLGQRGVDYKEILGHYYTETKLIEFRIK